MRGFPLPTVGLIAGTSAAVGIASIPLAGIIVDRIGGKRTLVGSLVLLAIGFGGYAFVHEPWQAFLTSAVVGIGSSAFWPSQSALIIGLTRLPEGTRPSRSSGSCATSGSGSGVWPVA